MNQLVGLGGIFCVLAPSLHAEVEDKIPLGIEAVTGLRSHYVHRGFELAETALDFQMEAEVSLSKYSSIHFGLSHLAESEGDFSETSIYGELTYRISNDFTIGSSLTYRDRSGGASLLESGIDLGVFSSYALSEDWRWRNELHADFGEGGLYFASEVEWSQVLSENSFLTVEAGLSLVSHYGERDGLHDFHTRLSYTYALSDRVAFTPFVGTSLQLNDSDASDVAYGGFWFEVIF